MLSYIWTAEKIPGTKITQYAKGCHSYISVPSYTRVARIRRKWERNVWTQIVSTLVETSLNQTTELIPIVPFQWTTTQKRYFYKCTNPGLQRVQRPRAVICATPSPGKNGSISPPVGILIWIERFWVWIINCSYSHHTLFNSSRPVLPSSDCLRVASDCLRVAISPANKVHG